MGTPDMLCLQDVAIQRAASLAKRARTVGVSTPAVESLASLGAGGKWAGNSERDLWRRFPEANAMVHYLKVPMKRVASRNGTHWADWPFICPHDVLIQLENTGYYTEAVGSDTANDVFWRAWAEDPLLCPSHRMRHTDDLNVLPLYIHSDEVQVRTGSGGNEAHRVWSWSAATTRGNSDDTKMLITQYPSWCVAADTEAVVIGILGWLFDILWAGVVPAFDCDGRRLENAKCKFQRSALAGYKSDAAEKVKIHKYSRYYTCVNIRERCWASTTAGLFYYGNLHPTAVYTRYPIDAAQFKALKRHQHIGQFRAPGP